MVVSLYCKNYIDHCFNGYKNGALSLSVLVVTSTKNIFSTPIICMSPAEKSYEVFYNQCKRSLTAVVIYFFSIK